MSVGDQRKTPWPTRRQFLLSCGLAGAAALGAYAISSPFRRGLSATAIPGSAGALQLQQRQSRALGSEISILVLHEDAKVAQRAFDAAFAQLSHIEQVMSIYLPDSQLSQLNAQGSLKNPDPFLVQILHHAQDMSQRSTGAFDVTVQPFWNIYASAKRSGHLPSETQIAAARQKVDWHKISIEDNRIRLAESGMSITLNGIAQGFAADRVMETLKQNGIANALVNAGEIASLGHKAERKPWVVGIQHPRREDAYLGLARLEGRCLSTSGDYATTFSNDKLFNHIFEPWSGHSPLSLSSVTVIAPTATLADALSTAIFVLGPEKGMQLARSFPATDLLLVTKDGQTLTTDGFPCYS